MAWRLDGIFLEKAVCEVTVLSSGVPQPGVVPKKLLHWKKVPMKNVEGSLWAEKSVASSDITEHSNELVKLFFEDPVRLRIVGERCGRCTEML